MRRRLSFAAVLLSAFAAAIGQERLSVQGPNPATVRLGDSSTVLLRIDGASADPRPPKLPEVPGLLLELSPAARNSSSFFDGRSLTQNLTISYVLTIRPQREGAFVVPPLSLWTGTREQQTTELRLDVRKDLRGEELGWIEVRVEPQRVYVHEPVRVRVDFGIDPGLRIVQDYYDRYRYLDLEVQAAWLNEFPCGDRIELPPPQGDLRLIVGNRQLFQAFYDGNHERAGRRWQRFTFDRAFLPTQVGKFELPAPTLRYHVLLREGQTDVFGRGRGQQSDNFYAFGKPLQIEVLPIPEVGRPTPYYGAVGRFQIEAALDKDSVRVGSSVKLTVTVRGQGNLEYLRMPTIESLPGFHKLGQAEAVRDADRVVVTYDLTPLSTDVHEVPSIGWNYFDTTPGVEKFVAVATAALPLAVSPLERGETLAPLPDAAPKSLTPGKDDIFDLPDFGGQPAVAPSLPAWLPWLAVFAPWLLAVLVRVGYVALRRRAADVAGQRARGALRACRRALADGADPLDAMAGYLGDRLALPAPAIISPDLPARLAAAGVPPDLARDVAAAVELGTAARYGGGQGLTAAAVEELVGRLEGQRFGARVWLPWLLWPVLAAGFAGELTAQSVPDAERGLAAYRAGDHRVAEQAFADALAATGDRRFWRARGNCFYRLGELPKALWAFESAALGSPRDAELLANLQLVRRQLQIEPPAGGFVAELAALRDRLLVTERVLLCALCMAAAAGCFVFGWRRVGWRWLGVLFLAPGCALAADVLWLAPARPPLAIALADLPVTAEPRAGLEPVVTVRAGKDLQVLGGTDGTYVRVLAGERAGYARRESLAIVR
jgi:hypothetical protein